MNISTLVVVGCATIAAICGSILAAKKQLPAANAVLLWVEPIWLYFVSECLNRGGCSWLVWIEVARQLLTAIFFVAAVALGPTKVQKYHSTYDVTRDI